MTAEEIIEQARDYSPLFTRQAIPDVAALKALSRIQMQLHAAVTMESPEFFSGYTEITLPAGWQDGVTLPQGVVPTGVEVTYSDLLPGQAGAEIHLVSPKQVDNLAHLYPSAYVLDNKLYLTDVRRWFGDVSGWDDVAKLRIRHVKAIPPMTRLRATLALPDTAEPALVANLALWMSDRLGVRLPTLRDQAADGSAMWVAGVLATGPTRTWMVEVVE
jgi:hypothetical protein